MGERESEAASGPPNRRAGCGGEHASEREDHVTHFSYARSAMIAPVRNQLKSQQYHLKIQLKLHILPFISLKSVSDLFKQLKCVIELHEYYNIA